MGGVERFVENAINLYEQEYDFIALQAAYLMLWTAIERLLRIEILCGKRDGQVETLIEQSIAHDEAITKVLKKSEHPPHSDRYFGLMTLATNALLTLKILSKALNTCVKFVTTSFIGGKLAW